MKWKSIRIVRSVVGRWLSSMGTTVHSWGVLITPSVREPEPPQTMTNCRPSGIARGVGDTNNHLLSFMRESVTMEFTKREILRRRIIREQKRQDAIIRGLNR